MSRPARCHCGTQPEVQGDTSYSGGGRYKGKKRSDTYEVRCPKCDHYIYRRCPAGSKDEAIRTWNAGIKREASRKKAADKLLWELENSGDETKLALARIIRAVEKGAGE